MQHPNFTAERVAAFACPAGKAQRIYWDGKTPGLGLRVTEAGAKAYVFEARLNNRGLRVTIGDARTWAVAAAQAEATRLKQLTDRGVDPRVERAELRAKAEAERMESQRRQLRVSEAWAAYVAHPTHGWGDRHRRDHLRLAQAGGRPRLRRAGCTKAGPLAPLMSIRFAELTAAVLEDWLAVEAATRPASARHAFVLFRAFLRWCAARPDNAGLIDLRIIEGKDLRKLVPRAQSRRHDVLERGHLRAWFAAVRSLRRSVCRAYLQALLLTGARKEELASVRWDDVDFAYGSLWIKDKVREEGRKVPLTPYLAHLLSALPRRNQWVFSSPSSVDGRMNEPRLAHNRALSVAGLPHVTLHGLRRTFASLAEWVEMPRGVVAQIMGHAPSATAERHYINRPLDLLGVWHGKYEAWILKQAGVRFTARKKQRSADAKRRRKAPSSQLTDWAAVPAGVAGTPLDAELVTIQ